MGGKTLKYERPVKNDAPAPQLRRCLGPLCRGGQTFLSTGPENRLCKRCLVAIGSLHAGPA